MRQIIKNIIIGTGLLTGLYGCFEKEELIIPIAINEIRIPFSLYEYQVYYRMEDETIVSYNLYDEWDLGFECAADGFGVILNSSRYMHAGDAGSTDFASVTTNSADTMIYDDSSGDLTKSALAGWVDLTDPLNPVFTGKVFIIDRGYNEDGESFGYKKLVIEKLETGTYSIRYANLDGSDENVFQITKDGTKNFVQFSFEGGGNLNTQQPASLDWDICFTKYSTIILDDYGTPTPYIVRGALINGISGIEAAVDRESDFYSIDTLSIPEYLFSSVQDIIGYEWKDYIDEQYVIVDGISYVVKDKSDRYFKLRFTDYFDNGQKGYPSFEQIKIKE